MKTIKTNTKTEAGLPSRPEHSSTAKQAAATDNRPAIDFVKRHANRQLATDKLIALLRSSAPEFFEVAEVVGEWVWIQFTDKQPRDITARLAEFGFHWNNQRQAWQHPCGQFRRRPSPRDPRTKYGSRFAADSQVA